VKKEEVSEVPNQKILEVIVTKYFPWVFGIVALYVLNVAIYKPMIEEFKQVVQWKQALVDEWKDAINQNRTLAHKNQETARILEGASQELGQSLDAARMAMSEVAKILEQHREILKDFKELHKQIQESLVKTK
jgi:hypothetical protein